MEELSQERKKRKKLTDQIHRVEVGCSLSGTLFIFGIEILALAIKKNPKIEGIRVAAREVKITVCGGTAEIRFFGTRYSILQVSGTQNYKMPAMYSCFRTES